MIEASLQIRSHLRYGQSVFNVFAGLTRYVADARTGLVTLRPNTTFTGSQSIVTTNSLGLRSAEVEVARRPGSLRIAVLGASTVMGAYTKSNEGTFPARLEGLLRSHLPGHHVEVINAGIADHTLADQRLMLQEVVIPLRPDLVIVYPGFNDYAYYCRQRAGVAGFRPRGLPTVELPSWLLTIELVKKNTMFLRPVVPGADALVDPSALDVKPYRQRLAALTETARTAGLRLVLATNARAYQADQPIEEQETLSESARFYSPCFDTRGLNRLYDIHNAEIRNRAAEEGVPLLPLDQLIPGGRRYFTDSTHFSAEGEEKAAIETFAFLKRTGALQELVEGNGPSSAGDLR